MAEPTASSVSSQENATVLKRSTRYVGYRKLVSDVSDQLRKENALRLAYLYNLPAWYYEVGPTHDSSFALRVLIALEGYTVFTPDSLIGLRDALKLVNRDDLAALVDEFVGNHARHTWEDRQFNSFKYTPTARRVGSERRNPIPMLHSQSMTAIAASKMDDVEKDFGGETGYRSHDNLRLNAAVSTSDRFDSDSDLDAVSNGNCLGEELDVHHLESLQNTSVENFRLALNCAYLSAKSLHKQLCRISEQSEPSVSDSQTSPLTSTPSSTSVPVYLSEAVSTAKNLANNLKMAVTPNAPSQRLPSSRSEPQTPARSVLNHSCSSGPLVKVLNLASSLNDPPTRARNTLPLAHSTSAGEVELDSQKSVISRSRGPHENLSKRSNLSGGVREMSVLITEKDVTTASQQVSPINGNDPSHLMITLSAPQPEHMHTDTPHSGGSGGSLLRRKKSKREVRQLSRKGLLFWQIKVKNLQKWLTQAEARIESDDFFDHYKRTFKASLYPFGLGKDEGKFMTLTINYLDEPRIKDVPNSKLIVNLLDPRSTVPVIPSIEHDIQRRGVRFVQQFVSHGKVEQFCATGVIIITVAIVSASSGDSGQESN